MNPVASPYHASIALCSNHVLFAWTLAGLLAAELREGAISVTLTRWEREKTDRTPAVSSPS